MTKTLLAVVCSDCGHQHVHYVDEIPSAATEAREKTEDLPSQAQENLRDKIMAERAKGNVVFWGLPDQLAIAPLEQFVEQPVEGILYDLNRLEEVCMTFITDKKWVNDFAVAMTIRKLVEQRDAARSPLRQRDPDALKKRKQPCTCTGSCRGPEGLGEGWVCGLTLPQ